MLKYLCALILTTTSLFAQTLPPTRVQQWQIEGLTNDLAELNSATNDINGRVVDIEDDYLTSSSGLNFNNVTNPPDLQAVTDIGVTTTNIITVPALQLDTTFTDGVSEGRLQWNATDGVPEIGLPGGKVNMQIGNELPFRVVNVSGATISNGWPVAFVSIPGTRRAVVPYDPDAGYPTNVCDGVATEDIPATGSRTGYMVPIGTVRELVTTGFTEGDRVYAIKHGWSTTPVTNAYVLGTVEVVDATLGEIMVSINATGDDRVDVKFKSVHSTGAMTAKDDFNTDYVNAALSAGRLFGGCVSVTGTTIHVEAGGGLCKIDGVGGDLSGCPIELGDGFSSGFDYVSWDALELTAYEGYNIIFYDYSEGVMTNILKSDFFTKFDVAQDFTVGRTYYDTVYGSVSRLCGMNVWSAQRRNQIYHDLKAPVELVQGGAVGASGLQITLTAGRLVAEGYDHFSFDAKPAATNFYYWRETTGGYTFTATNVIDNLRYNLVDADGYEDLTVNRWRTDYVYLIHDGTVHVVMGQGNSTSAANSESLAIPTPPDLLAAYGTLVARVTIQRGASSMTVVNNDANVSFSAVSIPEHNGLAGLNDGTTYLHLTAAEKASYAPYTGATNFVDLGSQPLNAGATTTTTFRATGAAYLNAGALPASSVNVDDSTFGLVGGSTEANAILFLSNRAGSSTEIGGVLFKNTDSSTEYTASAITSHNGGASDDGDLRFYTTSNFSSSLRMIIDYLGNVGIGYITPSYKLDVNGTLRATGAATLGSTLGVTGLSTLGPVSAGATTTTTFRATGAATFDNNVKIGSTETAGKLNVASAGNSLHTDVYIDNYENLTVREPRLLFRKSLSDTEGQKTETTSGTELGIFRFDGVGTSSTFVPAGYLNVKQVGSSRASSISADFLWNMYNTSGVLNNIVFANSGNLLVNTTTDAGYKLDVNGTLRATGAATFGSTLGVAGTATFSGNAVGLVEGLRLYNTFAPSGDSTTGVKISGYIDNGAGAPIEAGTIVMQEENTWIGTSARDSFISFSTRLDNVLTEKARIASSGNILVNTTNDAGYKLDVNGTLRSTGAATFDSTLSLRGSSIPAVYTTFETNGFSGTTFGLPQTPLASFTPRVYVNGLRQGSTSYSIATTNVTFTSTLSSDDVQVDYAY